VKTGVLIANTWLGLQRSMGLGRKYERRYVKTNKTKGKHNQSKR
jgi:hypothetical protein